MTHFSLEENKQYWEDPRTVSIIDINLHELEIQYVSQFLKAHDVVADIGSGNGDATIRYAKKVRRCIGIERSNYLRDVAVSSANKAKVGNVQFTPGDILSLNGLDRMFSAIVTQRVIINLPSWKLQKKAIDNIYRCLRPGGRYIMIENTNDGNEIMNSYRKSVDIASIPTHWHNLFLDFPVFEAYIKGKFRIIDRCGFNLYYFLTRVYVPMFASFTGFGRKAKADPIFKKSDRAARILFDKFGKKIIFKDNTVFGPIQGIVLEKI